MRLGIAVLLLAVAAPVAAQAPDERFPIPVQRMAPVYPREAARNGVEGFVEMEIEVRADGSVGEVEVLAAQPAHVFEDAALRAVKQWRFTPSKVASRRGFQTLEFKVEGVVRPEGVSVNLPAEAATPPVIKPTPQGIMLVPADSAPDAQKKPKP